MKKKINDFLLSTCFIMMPSHKKILALLQTKEMTINEIIKKTGLSYDGIRGRISELKKTGYVIEKNGPYYRLIDSKKKQHADEILILAEERHFHNQKITVTQLQQMTKMNRKELIDALSDLYHRGQLLQISNETIIIYI